MVNYLLKIGIWLEIARDLKHSFPWCGVTASFLKGRWGPSQQPSRTKFADGFLVASVNPAPYPAVVFRARGSLGNLGGWFEASHVQSPNERYW